MQKRSRVSTADFPNVVFLGFDRMTSFLVQTIWMVPVYAILGATLSILWLPAITRRTGPRPAGYINLLMTLAAFIQSLLAFPLVWNQPPIEFTFTWLQVANLTLTLPIEISAISVGAITIVTGLNLLAQLYAIGYMEMDWGWGRFYCLLAFFEAGMCSLALCDSLLFSYIILELLTLGTYLLVGFWFNQSLVVTGARDAFLTKRVGDLFMLMGVVALWPLVGTWDFSQLGQWAASEATQEYAAAHPTMFALLGLALIAGPMGKCAQFPLHLWLDEAMEGPIPSTILRNSVVVSTGAWILIKLEPVLALSPFTLSAAVFIGLLSAVGGSLIAIGQIDIKRALSYLTTAYLGLVFVAVGTLQNDAAFHLLLTHAIAVALLIMSAGAVIWNSVSQDLTQLGGLWSRRPISGLAFVVGTVGLIAFPPLGGFWALLELADGLWATKPWLVGILLVVNALTAFGLARVFGLIFGGKPKQMSERSPEVHWPMILPMTFLLGLTLHMPFVLQRLGLLPNWQVLNKEVALLLIWSSLTGLGLGSVVYLNNLWKKPVKLPFKPLQDFVAYDFYTPKIYHFSIVFVVDVISKAIAWFDRYIVDGLVNLVGLATVFGGQGLKYNVSGQTQFYALSILLGIALFVGLLTFGSIDFGF
jgi:NAD(P)H-quinone oxidoreductase subunit 5